MNAAMNQAEQEQMRDEQKMDSIWEQAVKDEGKMDEYLESEYKTMLEQLGEGNEEMLGEAWQKASDYEENMLYSPKEDKEYRFKENNPFREDA